MMRIICLLLLVMMGVVGQIQAANLHQDDEQVSDKQVYAVMFLVDHGVQPPRIMSETVVSRQNPNVEICWVSHHLKLPTGVIELVETFVTPAPSQFFKQGATILTSPDGRVHKVISTQEIQEEDSQVSRCWKIEKQDPIGDYFLTLNIGHYEFMPLKFKVIDELK